MTDNVIDEIYTQAMKDAYDALVHQKEYEREEIVRKTAVSNTERAFNMEMGMCKIHALRPDVIGFPMNGKLKLSNKTFHSVPDSGLYDITIDAVIPNNTVVSIYGITEASEHRGLVMMELTDNGHSFGNMMLRPSILEYGRYVCNMPFPPVERGQYVSITLYAEYPEIDGVYILGVMAMPYPESKNINSVIL